MTKALAALFISLGFLAPVLASAHSSSNKPSKDRTPPSTTSIHIASNNADASRAKAGDTVTITFTTSEKVETPVVLVNSRPVILRAAGTGGTSWVASYQVGIKDRVGKALYALAMEDMADNGYACTSIRLPFVAYCPPTDGSSVTIYKDATPPPPPADTEAPVIAAHEDVYMMTTNTSAEVFYSTPAATDNVDTSVPVSCAPVSGFAFALGTSTVTCTAQDTAGNGATSTFAVIVEQEIVVPPADTEAPVIEAHADVFATTTDTSAVVSYIAPLATDNVDTSVSVSCTPASGSEFSLGTTTVICTAQDTAGNGATSTFTVVVAQEVVPPPPPPPVPQPYTMASQQDESYLCGVENASWRYCDLPGTFSFTDAVGEGVKTIDLGIGSSMGTGTIQTVTIAKDPAAAILNSGHPWLITISCFVDPAHTTSCGDWAAISDNANDTTDGTYWSADFSALGRVFTPTEYYVMTIDDTGWETPAYGSEALQQPYWQIAGLR